MSTEKKIFKNGLAATLQKLVKVLEQIFLVPFFIKYWGPAYYGQWLTLTVVPAFLALSDFGFGSATANAFLLKYASGKKQEAANIAKTGVIILSFLICIAIILSIAIILILNEFNLFDNLMIPRNDAILATIILLISRIINFYQQLFEAHYRAARKASMSINFQTLISAANIIGGVLVLTSGGKVIQYAFVSLIISLVLNPIYIFTAEKVLALGKECKGIFIKSEVRDLIKKGFGYFLAPIWQAIYFQGSTFIINIVLGPIAVTTFNTVRTVVRSSSQGFSILISAVYPEFQFELAAGNFTKAKKIFFGVLGANIIMALFFMIFLALFGSELYSLWTHKALDVSISVWWVFIISVAFYSVWYTCSFIFEALNRPYSYTAASLICSIIAVGLFWYFSSEFGIVGAAIAHLSFDLLMCFYLMPKSSKIMEMPPLSFIRSSFSQIFEIAQKRLHN